MNSQPAAEPIRIFLAEDNVADVVLIREAFKGLKCAHNLLIVQDGEKAIQFIERIDQEESVACPSLLLAGSQLTKTKRHRSTSAPSAKPEVRQEVVEGLLG